MTNRDLLEKIVTSLAIRSTDTVLELGCGTGEITTRLLPVSRKVVGLESDPTFANEATSRAKSLNFTNFEMLGGDALSTSFPRFDVCFSNLPYSLSAPILFKLISHRPLWRSAVLILQREFTDALIADPGERNYSRLSMNAAVFVRTERLQRVNGACFYPVPPVESALVKLTPRNPPPLFDFHEFNSMTKMAFLEKKRSLKAVFARPFAERTLETNYKTYCSFHRIPTSPLPFPQYLRSALVDSGLAEYPAKHLSSEAMEHLLDVFHDRGIFFTALNASQRLRTPGHTLETTIGQVAPQISSQSLPVLNHVEQDMEAIPVVS